MTSMPTDSPTRTSLIIDTDTGSDDAVALLIAQLSGLAHVRAVTTVAGNVDVQQATRNALYTLELSGALDVPVYVGCERPLLRPHQSAQHVHGQDGMSDTDLPQPLKIAEHEHAVDALLQVVASEPPDSLTLVTLAPLTNIASALVRNRDLFSRLRHVYCMAGSATTIGNIAPTAEYNVWADPESAAVVLDAATPDKVTFIGCDVSERDAVMTPSDQAALRGLDTDIARFADDINQAVNHWGIETLGLAGYDLPDPIAMSIALDPSLVTSSETAYVRVVLGDEARGQLIIDRRRAAPTPNVTLVRRADSTRFKDLLFDVCAKEPSNSR